VNEAMMTINIHIWFVRKFTLHPWSTFVPWNVIILINFQVSGPISRISYCKNSTSLEITIFDPSGFTTLLYYQSDSKIWNQRRKHVHHSHHYLEYPQQQYFYSHEYANNYSNSLSEVSPTVELPICYHLFSSRLKPCPELELFEYLIKTLTSAIISLIENDIDTSLYC